MSTINGVYMPNFSHEEIPYDKAIYMDKRMLSRIQEYRETLGHPFSISMADGALIRFDGRLSSEHRVSFDAVGRLTKISKAIDGFPNCNIFEAWSKALSCNLFKGVGVYFDTKNNHGKPQPMLHLDLRPIPLIWYRDEGEYFYPHRDENFFENLIELFIKR